MDPQQQHEQYAERELASSSGDHVIVTPDEVLALGVLTLAGLWPGTWSGIAAIIVQKVDRLAKRDAVDIPFRRCAESLVDMLLRNPGDSTAAVETWQHLASAQARLPEELAQVLGLACSLLQRRTMEAAHIRARKKRRRNFSVDTVARLSAPPPPLTPPCATALVVMVNDMGREEEESKKKTRESLLPTTTTATTPHVPPVPPPSSSPLVPSQLPPPPAPLLPLSASPPPQHASPGSSLQPQLAMPARSSHRSHQQPVYQSSSPSALPPLYSSMPADHVQNGDGWGVSNAGAGSASAPVFPGAAMVGSPLSVPSSGLSPPRLGSEWNYGAGHPGLQGSYPPPRLSMPPPLQPPPPRGVDYALHYGEARAAGEGVVHYAPPVYEAAAETGSSLPLR